jgi:hypothetical protein
MRLQRFAYAGGIATLTAPAKPVDPLGPRWRALLGEPTQDVLDAVAGKQQFVDAGRAAWPSGGSAWARIRTELAPLLAVFADVSRALVEAGIPDTPGFLGIDASLLRDTFRHASRLRARYTVIDFLEGQGALEPALSAAIGTGA